MAVKSTLCSILDKIVPPVDTKTVVQPDDNDDALSSCSDSSGTSTLSSLALFCYECLGPAVFNHILPKID